MEKFVNILETGHTIKTAWKRDIGDTCAVPNSSPVKYSKVKFSLTQIEYDLCLENSKKLEKEYFDIKTVFIQRSMGWPEAIKTKTIKTIYERHVEEPLMTESFFLTMAKFN